MYQHIQLRRSSNWSSKAISQKVNASNVFKEKEVIEIYDDDDVLVLKELSNKMDELEEVILVEDDDALSLPQLSNESWDDFVDELTKKYEYDALQTTSVPQTTTAKRKFHISARNLSRAQRGYAATRDDSVISISSDEDEQSSTVLPSEQTHSSRKDFSSRTQVPSATNSCTSPSQCELLTSVVNEGIKSLEEENKLDSGQPIEHIATAAIERVNNETTQSTEPNLTLLAADTQNQIEHNVMTETNSSTTCTDNITLSESLRSKAPSLSKHKGLSGINKKYHDIKRRTYKLTFHQILQIFDIEGAALSAIGAVPGEPIDLDFPDLDMREFVKIVKNYQETESVDDVRHLWTQIKSWLSAMKPAYGTTTNYTKYHKKLNWYLSELMAQYIKFEIEHSIQNENYYKLKMEALMHTVSSLLNDDVNLKILTLLRTNFPDRPSNFLDDLFKKFLTHPKVRLENNDYGIYRLKVLAFQKWMHYSNRKKEDIVDIAIKEGSAYLPRLVPKNTEDPFYRVDYNVQLIDDYDKQGTRKILAENVSIDVLKNTINNYLLVYERQLFDDIVYRLSRRQCLEHRGRKIFQQTSSRKKERRTKNTQVPTAVTAEKPAITSSSTSVKNDEEQKQSVLSMPTIPPPITAEKPAITSSSTSVEIVEEQQQSVLSMPTIPPPITAEKPAITSSSTSVEIVEEQQQSVLSMPKVEPAITSSSTTVKNAEENQQPVLIMPKVKPAITSSSTTIKNAEEQMKPVLSMPTIPPPVTAEKPTITSSSTTVKNTEEQNQPVLSMPKVKSTITSSSNTVTNAEKQKQPALSMPKVKPAITSSSTTIKNAEEQKQPVLNMPTIPPPVTAEKPTITSSSTSVKNAEEQKQSILSMPKVKSTITSSSNTVTNAEKQKQPALSMPKVKPAITSSSTTIKNAEEQKQPVLSMPTIPPPVTAEKPAITSSSTSVKIVVEQQQSVLSMPKVEPAITSSSTTVKNAEEQKQPVLIMPTIPPTVTADKPAITSSSTSVKNAEEQKQSVLSMPKVKPAMTSPSTTVKNAKKQKQPVLSMPTIPPTVTVENPAITASSTSVKNAEEQKQSALSMPKVKPAITSPSTTVKNAEEQKQPVLSMPTIPPPVTVENPAITATSTSVKNAEEQKQSVLSMPKVKSTITSPSTTVKNAEEQKQPVLSMPTIPPAVTVENPAITASSTSVKNAEEQKQSVLSMPKVKSTITSSSNTVKNGEKQKQPVLSMPTIPPAVTAEKPAITSSSTSVKNAEEQKQSILSMPSVKHAVASSSNTVKKAERQKKLVLSIPKVKFVITSSSTTIKNAEKQKQPVLSMPTIPPAVTAEKAAITSSSTAAKNAEEQKQSVLSMPTVKPAIASSSTPVKNAEKQKKLVLSMPKVKFVITSSPNTVKNAEKQKQPVLSMPTIPPAVTAEKPAITSSSTAVKTEEQKQNVSSMPTVKPAITSSSTAVKNAEKQKQPVLSMPTIPPPVTAEKPAITSSSTAAKNAEKQKQPVLSMPDLDWLFEPTMSDERITAASSNNVEPEAIVDSTTTEILTNQNENISKTVDDVSSETKPLTAATVDAAALEKVTPQKLTSVTQPPKRVPTPNEKTEVNTILAPIIVQPIIRIQSQTNRLERIDPAPSTSKQAFPFTIPESLPNLIDTLDISKIEVNDISRPERNSTPTLDELFKDEYELSSSNNLLLVQDTTAPLGEPPVKRLCVENVNKTRTTNEDFDMLKKEEKQQKKEQCKQNVSKTTDSTSSKTVNSVPKLTETEITTTTASDNAHVHTTAENYKQSVDSQNESKAEESATSKQQQQKPLGVQPPNQKIITTPKDLTSSTTIDSIPKSTKTEMTTRAASDNAHVHTTAENYKQSVDSRNESTAEESATSKQQQQKPLGGQPPKQKIITTPKDLTSSTTVDSIPKSTKTEMTTRAASDNAHVHTTSGKYTESADRQNEKKAEESPTSKQQQQKSLEVQPTKQKDDKFSSNEEPILICKETLIALKKLESAARYWAPITMFEEFQPLSPLGMMEDFQSLSPGSTPERCTETYTDTKSAAEKLRISPRQLLEDCKVEKSVPKKIEKSKILLSQSNQSNDVQQLGTKTELPKSRSSATMSMTKYDSIIWSPIVMMEDFQSLSAGSTPERCTETCTDAKSSAEKRKISPRKLTEDYKAENSVSETFEKSKEQISQPNQSNDSQQLCTKTVLPKSIRSNTTPTAKYESTVWTPITMMEDFRSLSAESTPERCTETYTDTKSSAQKRKISARQLIKDCKAENSVLETLENTKDLLSQPNQLNQRTPKYEGGRVWSPITMLEDFHSLSAGSTSESGGEDTKPLPKKRKISARQLIEDCKAENNVQKTLDETKDLLSQPNQSNESLPSPTMPTTNCESSPVSVTPSSDEHSTCARTSIVQCKNRKGSITSPALAHESPPSAKSNATVELNKTNENVKANSQTERTEGEDVRHTLSVKSNLSNNLKDLPIAEAISKSETKKASPSQTPTKSPRSRVPPKPMLAVAPTLLLQNANRFHPYHNSQTAANVGSTHRSKLTPEGQRRDSLLSTPENNSNKKRENVKSADKTTPQRNATTRSSLMQSRLSSPRYQSSFGTPAITTDPASAKLTAEEEADIARKLTEYRTNLPPAKTYGAHKENQRLVNLYGEILRLEYAERAIRRKAKQLRNTQRLKRKLQTESNQARCRKSPEHREKPDATNSSNGNKRSDGDGHRQHRSKQQSQYVNKFGEIEKLVEKEKATEDTEAKCTVPLTASTAWEPKMPTGHELIELLSKTKKS